MRGINWPAGFDACASKCSVRVLICVWSQMSCYKWLKLSFEFNFAVRHTSGHTNPLREIMTSQWSNLSAIIIDAFVNKFNCSKHDVTMASGSQATVSTCNDYSGSKVQSFSSRCGRHDTLSLLTVITKVLSRYRYAHIYTCVGDCFFASLSAILTVPQYFFISFTLLWTLELYVFDRSTPDLDKDYELNWIK